MNRAKSARYFIAAFGLLLMVGCATVMSGIGEVPFISVDQLEQMLGSPDLVIVDVRDPVSWSKSDTKIKGAVREDPRDVDVSTDKYPRDKRYVFYCA